MSGRRPRNPHSSRRAGSRAFSSERPSVLWEFRNQRSPKVSKGCFSGVGGGGSPDRVARGLPTGGQWSKVYVLGAEPKEHKHFRPGTRPGGSVTGVTVPIVYVPFPAPSFLFRILLPNFLPNLCPIFCGFWCFVCCDSKTTEGSPDIPAISHCRIPMQIQRRNSHIFSGDESEKRRIRLNFWDTLREQFCLSDQSALIGGPLWRNPL